MSLARALARLFLILSILILPARLPGQETPAPVAPNPASPGAITPARETSAPEEEATPTAPPLAEEEMKRLLDDLDRQPENPWGRLPRLLAGGTRLLPLLDARVAAAPPALQLVFAKLYFSLEKSATATDLCLRILASRSSNDLRRQTALILGLEGLPPLESRLQDLWSQETSPRVRLALSLALWKLAKLPAARHEIQAAYEGQDESLRQEAALYLAETGELSRVRPLLLEISTQPSPEGALARALLEREIYLEKCRELILKKDPATAAGTDYLKLLDEIIGVIRKYHITGDRKTPQELALEAAKALVARLDRDSLLWSGKEWTTFLEQIQGNYAGIGAYVGIRHERFVIISPIYSGPAYRAGIRSGDHIAAVDTWPTQGKPIDEIISRLKGPPGTKVAIKAYREGWAASRTIEIVREQITVDSVLSEMLPGSVGYLFLSQFGENSGQEVHQTLLKLEAQGMRALIFDLRNNGGGYLATAEKVAELFLEKGTLIVYSEGRNPSLAPRTNYYSAGENLHPGYPIFVLVNDGTASASEIVSGALQEHKRATILGERSFGKGTVQQPLPLQSDPSVRLKLTIARYYLPSGRCIHREDDEEGKPVPDKEGGIVPDIVIAPETLTMGKVEILQKLLEQKVFESYVEKYFPDNKKVLTALVTGDDHDAASYPGFDAWYQELHTELPKEDARRRVRAQVRQAVADERGEPFACDLQEDIQLQRAFLEALRALKIEPRALPETSRFRDKFQGR